MDEINTPSEIHDSIEALALAREHLLPFNLLSRRASNAYILSTAEFERGRLTSPGLTYLEDNIHTGWFYYAQDQNTLMTVFRRDMIPPIKQYEITREPFFQLNSDEAAYWEKKAKRPLTPKDLAQLSKVGDSSTSSYYHYLNGMELSERAETIQEALSFFWDRLSQYPKKYEDITEFQQNKKMDLIKNHLLPLGVINRISRETKNNIASGVIKGMRANRQSVLPIDDKGEVAFIRFYVDNGKDTWTMAKVGAENMHLFAGDEPMDAPTLIRLLQSLHVRQIK